MTKTVGDNKAFVDLMLATRDDAQVRATILQLLSLDTARRKPVILALLAQLGASGAPSNVTNAVSALLDDAVATAASQYIASPP